MEPLRVLQRLGSSPDHIGLSLLRRGFRGRPDDPRRNPVALYMSMMTRRSWAVSDAHAVALEQPSVVLHLPPAIQCFLQEFTKGSYPDLVSVSGQRASSAGRHVARPRRRLSLPVRTLLWVLFGPAR